MKVIFRVALILLEATLGTAAQQRSCPGLFETLEVVKKIPTQFLSEHYIVAEVCTQLLVRVIAAILRCFILLYILYICMLFYTSTWILLGGNLYDYCSNWRAFTSTVNQIRIDSAFIAFAISIFCKIWSSIREDLRYYSRHANPTTLKTQFLNLINFQLN